MTADVRIHLDAKEGVLVVPLEAVVKEFGKTFVLRVLPAEKGQKVETRTEKIEITQGLRNDREVEIALREVIDHLARCRAVCFPPLEEDYGFVTVEAFASSKPVITCRDSGGPAELVGDGINGFVCDPTPASLATALRRLTDDVTLAQTLGAEAHSRSSQLNWPDAVRQLTT